MTELISVPLAGGGSIIVEAGSAVDPAGVVKAGRLADGLQQAVHTLDSTLEPVASAAKSALDKLRAAQPDGVTLEFGVRLSGELGAIITRTTGECHMRVTLRWDLTDDRTG